MSIALNGTSQVAYHAAAPGPTFSALLWARRDTESSPAANEELFSRNDDSFFNRDSIVVNVTDGLECAHNFTVGGPALPAWTTGTWRFVKLTYQAESGAGAADGVLTLRYLADGGTAFAGSIVLADLSNSTANQIIIGAQTRAFASIWGGTIAFVKVWNGIVISDADALVEREYRHAQTNLANLWAEWTFDSGALGTDTSSNARSLTLVGSPTHSTDEPAGILGDDPGGSLTHYTLTADAGSVTITGTAATLVLTVDADPGLFQITGTDATLIYSAVTGFTLSAESHAFAISGTSASLECNRSLDLAAGAIAVIGTAAAPLTNRRLDALSGRVNLQGRPAWYATGKRKRRIPGLPWA